MTLAGARRRIRALAATRFLHLRSISTVETVLGCSSAPTVTMTTHGNRLQNVHLALESISRGTLLPSRLILWLDKAERLTPAISRLQERGLEVLPSENFGPHTKYWPYVELADLNNHVPLVTADDDIIYPTTWLADLVETSRSHPDAIVAHRYKDMSREEGVLLPYVEWQDHRGTTTRSDLFITGVSGAMYPQAFQASLRCFGKAFLDICPRADDIWLTAIAHHSKTPMVQVRDQPSLFPFVPGSQEFGLVHSNAFDHGNDVAIRRTAEFFGLSHSWGVGPQGSINLT